MQINKAQNNYQSKRNIIIIKVLCYIGLALVCLVSIFPFYMLIINSTKSHGEIMMTNGFLPGFYFFDNLKSVLVDINLSLFTAIFNSVLVSGFSAIIAVYFSAMTAYGIHIYDFRFKKFAFAFIVVVMLIPAGVPALGFLKIIEMINMQDTLLALIIPSVASPIVFFYMKQYLESNVKKELIDASRMDGAGEFKIFNTIILPMLKPAVALQLIFTFTASWNNYFIPALVINSNSKKTIPILIAQIRGADYMNFNLGKVYMILLIAIVPIIIVYIFLSKFIISGIENGTAKV